MQLTDFIGKEVKSITPNDSFEPGMYTVTFTDGSSIEFHATTRNYLDDPYVDVDWTPPPPINLLAEHKTEYLQSMITSGVIDNGDPLDALIDPTKSLFDLVVAELKRRGAEVPQSKSEYDAQLAAENPRYL